MYGTDEIKFVGQGIFAQGRHSTAVLTVSDTRTEETDTSGKLLAERLIADGHVLAGKEIIRDEPGQIESTVTAWMRDKEVDVVLATGGSFD